MPRLRRKVHAFRHEVPGRLQRAVKKSSQDVGLGGRITCSPSLRMYTSVPSKRNSAGRRTAWLRPLLKSLAVWFGMSILQ